MSTHPKIVFDKEHQSLDFIKETIDSEIQLGVQGVTFLLGKNYQHTQDTLDAFLKSLSIPVSGAIFPEVIYNNTYHDDAIIAILWYTKPEITTFRNISQDDSELYQHQPENADAPDSMTSLVFMDTTTRISEAALDALYYRNGDQYQYAGAGAGFADGTNRACILCSDGVVSDSLQVTCLPFTQQNYVGHGWSILSGPHLVTTAEENRVMSLDYQPIESYIREKIQQNHSEDLSSMEFQKLVSRFPIGLQPYDEDMLVRDPLKFEEGALHFIGDIPEFSNIYVLSGEPETLLSYVENNLSHFESEDSAQSSLSFIFSCIGRRFHMGAKSDDELETLSQSLKSGNTVIGTSSLGEIASNNAGLARLHSMSLVVSSLSV
jgi:hypothetical protein